MIGAYLIENDDETTIILNSERYDHMITDFFLEHMWFQQDGATCQTTRTNTALLQGIFPGHVKSCRGDINWSPCDLTPLDFFVGLRERPYLCR